MGGTLPFWTSRSICTESYGFEASLGGIAVTFRTNWAIIQTRTHSSYTAFRNDDALKM